MIALIIVILNLLLALLAFYNFYYKRRGLPPGPTPLPIIGNMWTIHRNPPGEDVYLKWREEYGPIYTYWMGEIPVVCVTDYGNIIEMFQKDGDTYAGRTTFAEFDILHKGGTRGVVMTEGDLWRDQRRFALHVLRDFGLGKNLMQERILTEVGTLSSKIQADLDAAAGEVDVIKHIDIAVGSIINVVMFGYRFDGEREKQFYILKAIIKRLFDYFGCFAMSLFIARPRLLIRLPYFRNFFKGFVAVDAVVDSFMQDQINEHVRELEESGSMDGTPTDYVHAFLQEKARRDKLGEPHYYSVEQLKAMCFDLWIAGQETSSTTLTWGLAYLIRNPEFQARLHEELDAVIGSDRPVTMTDRPHLPYTCAVVNEMQRIANLLPQNVLHRTTRDVEISGYHLKEGTSVIPQISAVLYDPEIYPDPKRFDPARHLDSRGHLKKCEELIPFSVGKRQCLGEGLARMELFLFMANMFNQWRFSEGTEPPKLSRVHGAINIPIQCTHFTCQVEKRHT